MNALQTKICRAFFDLTLRASLLDLGLILFLRQVLNCQRGVCAGTMKQAQRKRDPQIFIHGSFC